MGGEEGERWGFFNRARRPGDAARRGDGARARPRRRARPSPTRMTKTMLHQEWSDGRSTQAIEAEAQAQAICMQTEDFTRAYQAFAAKQKPRLRRRLTDGPRRAPATGRSSRTRIAQLRARARRLGDAAPRATATAADVDAACRALVARARRRPAGCATRSPARVRRRGRRDRHALDLPGARDAGAPLRASPTSRSRCRGWARARSASHGSRRAASSATCRAWRAARRSPRSRCRSPTPAPTSRRWPAPRASTATHYVLDGEKTWISNGGIADFYVVFARTGEAPGRARHLAPSSSTPARPASRSPSAST